MVVEFSNAEFVGNVLQRNLGEGLGGVWEQSNKTAEKTLLDLKCCLGQFGSVNKLTFCEGKEGEKTCLQELLALSPQMDSLNAYLI